MPRIDPLQLLKCLSVLLTPEGGILSGDEVPRLVNLMTKFSKKLVSKCIYVLILKNTKTELVDMFMTEGGWTLIQSWLQDAVQVANWHLVKEILGLLLITPVDVERLKLNILPKLIKSLSRREDLQEVGELSTQLVKQWLVIVKGSSGVGQQPSEKVEVVKTEDIQTNKLEEECSETISTNTFYNKDLSDDSNVEKKEVSVEKVKSKDEDKSKSSSRSLKSRDKERSKDKDRGSKDKDRYSKDKDRGRKDKDRDSKDRDKYRDRNRRSSDSSRSSSSKSSSSSSRDKDRKDRDRDRERDKNKDKDKYRPNGSIKYSSSNSSKDKKESIDKNEIELTEKEKSALDAFKTPSLEKLGRIPKKSHVTDQKETKESLEMKKKAFSIGIRKDSEERPKTVKIFNSKMRSTGLEEEAKPAPTRTAKKPPPPAPLPPPISLKRQSPTKDTKDSVIPPEKKIKIDKVDIPDRPGAIKLIPPKPKPMLQESDLFNEALTAATTSKKEPKKRKRRASTSKDTPTSPTSSPNHEQPSTPTTIAPPTNSPLGLKSIAPINFYQDTLSEEVIEENDETNETDKTENLDDSILSTVSESKESEIRSPRAVTPTEDDPEEIKNLKIDGSVKGVLLYTRKKGPKKTISWKNETDLVEIRYFELDETERVNVTKAFNDMAKMDISNEREAIQLSRKVGGEDLMEPQIVWRIPFEIDFIEPLTIIPGHRSLEKDIQFAREKSVLQALYFDKRKIPDSPEEPFPENHQMSDPLLIALDDPESQEIDLKGTPWPEPKGNAPLPEPQMPIVYNNLQVQFNQPFNPLPPQNFQNMGPRFPAVPMVPQVPNNFVPPNMIPNGNLMAPPNMMPPTELMMNPMNPNMFPAGPMPDNFGPEPEFPMYGNPNGPNNMNMFPPNNFNNSNHRHTSNRGGGGFRRGRGGRDNDGGNWVRMNESGRGNWRRGGGGNRGSRMCKNIQNHGYCRNGDNCPFYHP